MCEEDLDLQLIRGSFSLVADTQASDADDEHSSIEDSDIEPAQQPHSAYETPPLDFPGSPAPYEAVLDDGFNVDFNDQQSEDDQEVRSSLFNALDHNILHY